MNNLEKMAAEEPETIIDALLCTYDGDCTKCKAWGFCSHTDSRASRKWLLADCDGIEPCQKDGCERDQAMGDRLPGEPDDNVSKPLYMRHTSA